MDCEKFDNLMLDELYGELDEITSAAAKRHLSGCSRCSSALAGLKATRRVAILPLVDPPEGLVERILAATWEAQKVVPLKSRFARFFSVAGSWAMRPQTAMAAVFLLMIGSSVLYMSGKSVRQASQSSQAYGGGGSPAPVAKDEDHDRQRLDYASAASAHGTEPLKQLLPMATATAAPSEALALGPKGEGQLESRSAPGGGGGSSGALAFSDDGLNTSNASAPAAGGARDAPPTTAAANGSLPPAISQGYGKPEAKESGELERGRNQYKDKKYDEATKTLDGISGSPDAALWAARSVRDGQGGCGVAVKRFEDIAARSWGTIAAYEATFDAARCYELTGRMDLARARYSKMLSIPQYAARAQNELDRLRPVSAKPAAAPRAMDANEKANSY